MNGELRVVDNVAEAFAALVAERLRAAPETAPFVLGCSGGGSGTACFSALPRSDAIDFSRLALVFADERCVDPTSPDSNAKSIGDALGARLAEVAAFHPMSCEEGPEAYEALLRNLGGIDLLQLGLGPDGHTASLFPDSLGPMSPDARLVVMNEDPSGRNPFERMSLTFAAITAARFAVVTVMGPDKAHAISALTRGEALPASHIAAEPLIWLVDHDAASARDR